MVVFLSLAEIMEDRSGRTFRDVVARVPIQEVLGFFHCPRRQTRMQDAEYFDYPALSAIVKELEQDPAFTFLDNGNPNQQRRARQFVGVLVKLVMQKCGWKTTGRKASVGPFSKKFRLAEVYQKAT